jgi:hypothetical protein
MLGVHDCNLYLRDRLAQFMNDNKDLLKTHWRIERLKSDKTYGISSEDSKLDDVKSLQKYFILIINLFL